MIYLEIVLKQKTTFLLVWKIEVGTWRVSVSFFIDLVINVLQTIHPMTARTRVSIPSSRMTSAQIRKRRRQPTRRQGSENTKVPKRNKRFR